MNKAFGLIFILVGVFAIVGGLYTWGDGSIFSQQDLLKVMIPWADIILTGPLSIITGYGILRNRFWGQILGLSVSGIYVFGSLLVFISIIWNRDFSVCLLIPSFSGFLIGILFTLKVLTNKLVIANYLSSNQLSHRMKFNCLTIVKSAKVCVLLFFVLLCSCISTSDVSSDKLLKFSIQAGANMGGIVENRDLSVVPNVSVPAEATVDAFTGATQTGFNVGAHIHQPLGKNEVETGLDYMFNHHTFNYIDNGNMYIGVRRLSLSQIMLPLSYNFVVNRRIDFQIKLGFIAQYNLVDVYDVTVFNLPDYKIHPFSAGPTVGISAFPLKFSNGSKVGLYFDVYRGSRIYTDYYNQTSFEMQGSSFMKFGLKYQL